MLQETSARNLEVQSSMVVAHHGAAESLHSPQPMENIIDLNGGIVVLFSGVTLHGSTPYHGLSFNFRWGCRRCLFSIGGADSAVLRPKSHFLGEEVLNRSASACPTCSSCKFTIVTPSFAAVVLGTAEAEGVSKMA